MLSSDNTPHNRPITTLTVTYISSVSLLLFSRPIPETKKINPKIPSAHGLSATTFGPKMPNTPRMRPAIPSTTRTRANIFIISFVLYRRPDTRLNSPPNRCPPSAKSQFLYPKMFNLQNAPDFSQSSTTPGTTDQNITRSGEHSLHIESQRECSSKHNLTFRGLCCLNAMPHL